MKTTTLAGAIVAGFLAASATLGSVAAIAQPKPGGAPPPSAGVPAPKILVIDRNAILRASKVGQDIMRQVNGYTKGAESQFRSEGDSLQKEGRALQQQVAILAPDVKAKKIRDFQNKQASFQRKV